MQDYRELLTDIDVAEATTLLEQAGLSLPAGRDWGLGYYEDGRLSACGFLAGNVLCGLCVAEEARGTGISTALLSRLVLHGRERGREHFLIFTKAAESEKFQAAGFTLVARSEEAALLELGRPDYADWLASVRLRMAAHPWPVSRSTDKQPLGAIVMNANPFTRGHEHLARAAAKACARLLVFVVEEEASVVPFAVRFRLVSEGLSDVPNALVLPSGPYMVSRATFPAYFTAETRLGAVHAGLDCTLFASRIAPDLGIRARFVGTEPLDPVTNAYNTVMKRVFARHERALYELPRLEADGAVISASRVRALLQDERSEAAWLELGRMLPPTTYAFLRSEESAPLRRQLHGHHGRH